MKGYFFVAVVTILANLSIIQCQYCERIRENSVTSVYDVVSYYERYTRCLKISVPDNEVANVRIKIFDIVAKDRCQTSSTGYWWASSRRDYSTPSTENYWWKSSRRDYSTPSTENYWWKSSRRDYSTPSTENYWWKSSRRDYSTPSTGGYWWSTPRRDYSSQRPTTGFWGSTRRRDYSSQRPTTGDYWWSTSRRINYTSTPDYRTSPYENLSRARVLIHTSDGDRLYVFPLSNGSSKWITIRGSANITLQVDNTQNWCFESLKVTLKIEHKTVKRGEDEIRNKLATWMKSRFLPPLKWKENILRAVIALHLSGEVNFTRTGMMEELLIKQVDLKSSVALLRNSSDPISINKLAITVNSLLATCRNPREFYGYDLIQILKNDAELSQSTIPSAYLALCNANENISMNAIERLLTLTKDTVNQPFVQDIQAITVMALSCIKRRISNTEEIIEPIYRRAIRELKQEQLEDGSFGNVYSTAIITQALLSDGKRSKTDRVIDAAVKYLVNHLNTSDVNFLAAYYSLPLLNQKTLVDIGYTNCSKDPRKDDISDIEDKFGPKIKVKYSLFIGDKKDFTTTMSFRVRKDVTAYDVMRLAATADPRYEFKWMKKSGLMYIYQVSRIPNDPEEGHFWFTYYRRNGTLEDNLIKSPDKVKMHDGYHLILWYKSFHLGSNKK